MRPIYSVKSDALFSYQPPFNLLAFVILWPSSWVLSPRGLHSLNVFLIKLTVSRHILGRCTMSTHIFLVIPHTDCDWAL